MCFFTHPLLASLFSSTIPPLCSSSAALENEATTREFRFSFSRSCHFSSGHWFATASIRLPLRFNFYDTSRSGKTILPQHVKASSGILRTAHQFNRKDRASPQNPTTRFAQWRCRHHWTCSWNVDMLINVETRCCRLLRVFRTLRALLPRLLCLCHARSS